MSLQPKEDRLSLRASDADRQRVTDLLSNAYADGRLTIDEFQERNDKVWKSKTLADLAPLTTDLGVLPAATVTTASGSLARVDNVPARQTFAILANRNQAAEWVVPSSMSSLVVMGADNYDFRQATFTSPHVFLNLGVVMGTVVLRLPEGVAIIDHTVPIMANVETKGMKPPLPGAPIIELRGFVFMGTVTIQGAGYSTFKEKLGFRD